MRRLTRAGAALSVAVLAFLPGPPELMSARQALTPGIADAAPSNPLRTPAQAALSTPLRAPVEANDRQERDLVVPDGKGKVPTYRPTGPAIYVCGTDKDDIDKRVAAYPTDQRVATLSMWGQCQTGGFRTLQDAVASVTQPGATIKILPGSYLDAPPPTSTTPTTAATPPPPTGSSTACVGLPAVLTFAQQSACPAVQNTVGIVGKTDLQVEGVGATPEDVIIDAGFTKPYGIRVDRSPGTYLRNLTVEHATASAVYVMESDGFVLDDVTARWNDEYGLRMLAADHGVATECAAYGNGTAGISASSPPDVSAAEQFSTVRNPIEVRHCDSHQNLIGFSGSAGDSVWVHDSVLSGNSVGISTDSLGHLPGLPQNHAVFDHNEIGSNNRNFYNYVRDGTCAKPSGQRAYEQGVVCPTRGLPAGTGVINLGGNYDTWHDNWVYDNAYAGFVMAWAPSYFRGEPHVTEQFDTSNHNRVFDNHLGVRPNGDAAANGIDAWWDGQGIGSCWQGLSAGSVPRVLPQCGLGGLPAGTGTSRLLPEPAQALALYVCTRYDLAAKKIPSDCSWYGASGLGLLQNKVALGGAILLGLFLLAAWWRLARGSRAAFVGTTLALAGLVVGVYGSLRPTSTLSGLGLLLLGAGYVGFGFGLRGRRHPLLGWLTVTMGVFALLGGVDHLAYLIPWLPLPPSVIRIGLELIWLPCSLVAAPKRAVDPVDEYLGVPRGPRRMRLPRGPRRYRDPLERFAAALRDP
jgi:hypothetical protein